jgi:transcriptional regulator with XRE-family HTH domain
MTKTQFKAALAALDLSHSQAARVLGIGRSSVLRYLNGEQPVATTVVRLLHMLQTYKIPKEWM